MWLFYTSGSKLETRIYIQQPQPQREKFPLRRQPQLSHTHTHIIYFIRLLSSSTTFSLQIRKNMFFCVRRYLIFPERVFFERFWWEVHFNDIMCKDQHLLVFFLGQWITSCYFLGSVSFFFHCRFFRLRRIGVTALEQGGLHRCRKWISNAFISKVF